MVDLPSSFQEIELIVLDMDGVVTSEQAYWDAAGLTVRELLESPAYLGLNPANYSPIADLFYRKLTKATRHHWRKYLPTPLIVQSKMRGVNNNWDIAYLTFSLYWSSYMASILPFFQEEDSQVGIGKSKLRTNLFSADILNTPVGELQIALSPIWERLVECALDHFNHQFLRAQDMHLWGDYFRKQGRYVTPIQNIELRIIDDFHPDLRGLQLLEALNALVQGKFSHRIHMFGRNTQLWEDCRDIFQSWYLGEELYQKTYKRPLYYGPKPGLIHNEEPLFGREATRNSFTQLRKAGFKLGIATGRPRMEIRTPLLNWNVLHLFEQNRIVTHDDVEDIEIEFRNKGIQCQLGKPHPFAFSKAIYPEMPAEDLIKLEDITIPDAKKVLIVGDTQADIWGAQKIGCPVVAVLSGAVGSAGRRQLEEAKPDAICKDIMELSDALCRVKRKSSYTG